MKTEPTNRKYQICNKCSMKFFSLNNIHIRIAGSLLLFFFFISSFCQDKTNSDLSSSKTEDMLINQFIQSKGNQIIVFEPENIKRYWIDNSIASIDGYIKVSLSTGTTGLESIPLKIQLMNVQENQSCKVEVISNTEDLSFIIQNTKSNTLSSSAKENGFINYSIASSTFQLESILNRTFNIQFKSKTQNPLSIKRIILSFSNNKNSSYLSSPGKILYNKSNIETTSTIPEDKDDSFVVTGKKTSIFSQKKIILSDNALSVSATIENTGDTPTRIYMGYGLYNQDQTWLNGRNFPYSTNGKTLKVVSSEDNSKSIFVEGDFNWTKECYIAVNAKDDMSDIPSVDFAGTIADVKKHENGISEIILNAPLKTKLNKETKIRIHGLHGSYLYTQIKTLQPGEKYTFNSTTQKDDSFNYSSKSFPRGTYYVIPLILSYSVGSENNTIKISNFAVSY